MRTYLIIEVPHQRSATSCTVYGLPALQRLALDYLYRHDDNGASIRENAKIGPRKTKLTVAECAQILGEDLNTILVIPAGRQSVKAELARVRADKHQHQGIRVETLLERALRG